MPEFKQRAVSIHVYSKPFDSCEVYTREKGTYGDVPLHYTSEYGKLHPDEKLVVARFQPVLLSASSADDRLATRACALFHVACVTIEVMATATETRDIQKHVLANGLVVITETMTHVRSVSVGVWVRNGSRREVPEENGLAHFIEHMVFKGTERRSAEAIAREMDSVGGMLDAFTSKEQICFNAKVLDDHLPYRL